MKKIKLTNGVEVQLKRIEDIKTYRGFYVKIENSFYEANFNTAALPQKYKQEANYSCGYEFTHGDNILDHLYNKMDDGEELSKYEIYDTISYKLQLQPKINKGGKDYDFSKVMFKVPYFNFWYCNEEPSGDEAILFEEFSEGIASHSLHDILNKKILVE